MNRQKMVLVALTVALLVALGAWTYTSGGSSGSVADAGASGGSTETVQGLPLPAPSTSVPRETTSTAPPAPTTTVPQNPQAYAAAMYRYWTTRDKVAAATIATPAAATALFKMLWHKEGGWHANGCQDSGASTTCSWVRKHRNLTIQVQHATATQPIRVVAVNFQVVR